MTFLDLLGAVVSSATSGVAAGSRRNARAALDTRSQLTREGRDALSALAQLPAQAVEGRHSA